ncbi:MAG: AMP-binding protein [Lautropia sp.]|nr:AMP-binding protein [Lautropia sp.]
MNIANWLHQSARLHPELPALRLGEQLHASYAEFAARVAALAGWMQHEQGVAKGDRVVIFMANRCEYLEVAYAAWWIGAVCVPINYRLHPREAGWIVDDAEAALLVADTDEALDAVLDHVEGQSTACLAVDGEVYQGIVNAACTGDVCARVEYQPPVRLPPEALAWLFYTSGTTGWPKGVMLSHGNLVAMSLCYGAEIQTVSPRDAILYAAPMSHGAGLYNFIFVRHAAQHIVPPSRSFLADEIHQLAKWHGSVSLYVAPTMVNRLVRAAIETGQRGEGFRTIVYGGGPMYLPDLDRAVSVLGNCFVQIYGQGECPMTITVLPQAIIADIAHQHAARRRASVGVAHACVDVCIADEAGQLLPPNHVGEVRVRGPVVMRGYWRNPEASAQALRDGWLRTGDVGVLDEDGFLTLTDRLKDVIISGGNNVYSKEVEEVLVSHPDVQEAAVIGVRSTAWGEEVLAVVVPEADRALSAAVLDEWCRSHLAAFKAPKQYRLCTELPKSSYGKVLKRALREGLDTLEVLA